MAMKINWNQRPSKRLPVTELSWIRIKCKIDSEMANDNVTVVVAAPTRTVVPPAEKPGKFSGVNFKGLQQWVFFWITTLGLQKFTNVVTPVPAAQMPDREKFMIIEAWKQELQLIFHDLIAEDMVVNEVFQVAAMIEKLPPPWNDFKNYLKHKLKEMNLIDLVIRLKIEKDNKSAKKKYGKSSTVIGVNIVEKAPTKDKKRRKSNGQKSEQAKKNFKGNCYNYGKAVHKYSNYRAPRKDKDKGKGKSQANIVEEMEDANDLCSKISESNLVGNPK
ncbi:uncharacterized protein LOC125877321 [Solanum stenotomum]|uniref:uncharacterized protein LOC125877321 n=1 Tax=Solanum stenotomum TaxID=172797 RepID=UPI0020D1EBA9|nr:uncharacterized protein LOC125877321 [Solanum stenotomum]